MAGGTIAPNVSYLISLSPFPTAMVHHAHVGVHNVFAKTLSQGVLNFRAGFFFLMDFGRPGHRDLFPSPAISMTTTVGRNTFNLDDANLGAEVYGRPGFGPFHYEAAVVTGNMAGTPDRDDGKDLWGRAAVTAFQHTDHELSVAAFGYRGRSGILTTTANLVLAQRDVFWLAGGDAEDLFLAVRAGIEGTPMPGFDGALSDADTWDLVRYVQSLSRTATSPAPGQVADVAPPTIEVQP